MRQHRGQRDPAKDASARQTADLCELQKLRIDPVKALRDVGPHDGEHHQRRDDRRHDVAPQPDQRQDDEGGHGRALDQGHHRAEQGAEQRALVRQQGQQDPQQHRGGDPRQHAPDALRDRQPEFRAAGKTHELARDTQRRGQEQLLPRQRGRELPDQQPEQHDGERPQRFAQLRTHGAI